MYRLLILLAAGCSALKAQQPEQSDSLGPFHFRGMALSSKRVLWVSGTKGSVFRSTNGGNSWKALPVKDFPRRDFRDIHAWSRRRAIAMSSGDSAVIVLTRNGGKSWTTVYENHREGIFLDGMDMSRRNGVCLGDPMPVSSDNITARFLVLFTQDAGKTWKEFWPDLPVQPDEAAYAASGSSVRYLAGKADDGIVWITGGGTEVRMPEAEISHPGVMKSWSNIVLPLRGGPGWGAYTMCLQLKHGVVLGGNYKEFNRRDSIAAWFNPENRHFEPAAEAPGGYRSGSCYNTRHKLYFCTGTNGTDISADLGARWQPFSNTGGNVCVSEGNKLWVAANRGKIYRFRLAY